MLTSAVLRWSRSPPIVGGGMQKAGGTQNLAGRGWSKFWLAERWRASSLGSPSHIPGIPREPTLTKGKKRLIPTPFTFSFQPVSPPFSSYSPPSSPSPPALSRWAGLLPRTNLHRRKRAHSDPSFHSHNMLFLMSYLLIRNDFNQIKSS